MPQGHELQIVLQDDGWAVGTLFNALVTIVGDTPNAYRINTVQAVRRELSVKHRPYCGMAVVLDGAIKDMSFADLQREEMLTIFRPVAARVHGGGTVIAIESRGFVAAGLRALLNGLRVASRSPHPMQFVDNRREACNWIAPRLQSPSWTAPTAEELMAAVTELERKVVRPNKR